MAIQHEIVDWLDHHGDGNSQWRSKNEIIERSMEDVVIRTHGEVLYEDAKKLIIATESRLDTDLPQPLYRDYTVIYKKLILNRERFDGR